MSQTPTAFDTLYTRLNPRQKEAVDAIDGPVMVIAGPGTGKTQILTLRIANILKRTDVSADAILALTFTNAAAANMRKRLVAIIGSDAYRVSIYTFHSFANHLIDTYPERFPEIVGRSNCSEVERIDVVRTLLDQGRYEIMKPIAEPYHNVPTIMSALSHIKREGLTPEGFAGWVAGERVRLEARDDLYHEKGTYKGKMKGEAQKALRAIEKNEELAELYRRYQDELARRKRYDFDDSLLTIINTMVAHEDFLRELQEEYQYFLVDEHQDTNGAQNRILELLATYFDRPNLFVVGDEKQAIFRFQGASLSNFLYFEKKFTDVRRITLDTNYRSHQGVLDAAHSLISRSSEGINAPLVAHSSSKGMGDLRVKTFRFGADDEELLFLVDSIKKKLDEGVPAHEIAVLYRNNRDVEDIADYFERLGIPFLIDSGHGVLDDPDIRKLNLIMRALADLTNNDILARLLFVGFLDISVPDAYAILREAKHEKRSVFEVLTNLGTVACTQPESVRALATHLIEWKRSAENESFLHLFERVVRESGLLTHIQHSSFHTEKFDKLVRLFDEMKAHVRRSPFFTLTEYDTFLRILEDHNLTLEAKSRHIPNAVRLMTAHKAKGLEFDYVYIVQAYDGHWGGSRQRHYFTLPYVQGDGTVIGDDTDDERRLFYVAITRARKDVYVSYATQAPDGRDRVPSQFIEEVREEYRHDEDTDALGFAGKRPPLFVERQGLHGQTKYVEFVRTAFLDRGISATALNNYLTCPWKWFYENFFYTQFVPSIHQIKGTAVHTALEEYFNARNSDPTLDKAFLLERFKHYMEDVDLDAGTLERVLRDTGTALTGWYDQYHTNWPTRTKNELLVRGVLLDDTIRLTGKLDKLECLDDRCHEVRVIDYKTGKPKSRNEIEGTTKSLEDMPGAGGYKRQLVFYKLLLDRYNEGEYRMQEGVLDFIEPMESGKYRRESFTITNDDVRGLEEEIRRVAKEITTLSFWDTRCEDPKCAECALRDLME
ncbi:MAG: ATP-dependent helicase [Candidatus Pacebacteria bacterium]|nr:ATP-dependent helicase [Candidatus Paceibacterota bacterium]